MNQIRFTKNRCPLLALLFILAFTSNVYSNTKQDDLSVMSLDFLLSMDVIETITKSPEPLFEAPLGVSILKREDIYASGATSIPEALRLMPGVLVREQTPGVYDIHVRGFDNVASNTLLPFAKNTLTLVMIDYRIVFNYFSGGTFWETLPISIDDVEQIELIRGASSALYGPNAVTGVINIVTRKRPHGSGRFTANVDSGNRDDLTTRLSYDHSIRENLNARVSLNFDEKERDQDTYYSWNERDYIGLTDVTSTLTPDQPLNQLTESYPSPEKAREQFAINAMINYTPAEDRSLFVSAGFQDSDVQRVNVNNFATPLTTNHSETYFANASGKFGQWSAQLNVTGGEQETLGLEQWQYDFNVVDFNIERKWQRGRLMVRPTLSHRIASYDGSFIGGSQELTNSAASVLVDYPFHQRWRFLGAARLDQYNEPDDVYGSYQASVSYLPSVKHFFRVSAYRANRSPFMIESFLDVSLSSDDVPINYRGNTELDLMRMDSFEASYRYKPTARFSVDIEGFYAELDDFSNLVFDGFESSQQSTALGFRFRNYDLQGSQHGLSVDLAYDTSDQLKIRLYGNYQESDFSGENGGELSPIFKTDSNSGPEFFGGAVLDWKIASKWRTNLNFYYMSEQSFSGILEQTTLDSKTNLNARLSYKPSNSLTLSLNARGLLSDDQLEYGFADEIGEQYFANIRFTR
jgi:iron complex outermembrane receptor protein